MIRFIMIVLGFAIAGCSDQRSSPSVPQRPPSLKECGIASYYHHTLAGQVTASGEIYRPARLTAAHQSLPFDSWVRVTRLDNGRTVKVRINDRGPFVRGRIIDLSRAASKELDLPGADGITDVCIVVPG